MLGQRKKDRLGVVLQVSSGWKNRREDGAQAHGQAGELWGGTREEPGGRHTCSQTFHSRDVVPKPAGQGGQGQWRGRGEWGCVGAHLCLSVCQCALAVRVHAGTHMGARAVVVA